MSDESNTPELRWLIERIDRNHAETTTNIGRLETRVEAIPAAMDRYVRVDVYEARARARDAREDALVARVTRLENTDASEKAGNRSWLLGLAQMVLGAALGIVAAYMTARGAH